MTLVSPPCWLPLRDGPLRRMDTVTEIGPSIPPPALAPPGNFPRTPLKQLDAAVLPAYLSAPGPAQDHRMALQLAMSWLSRPGPRATFQVCPAVTESIKFHGNRIAQYKGMTDNRSLDDFLRE
eukprot:271968-Hanusia_phi.AAC.1